jgi:hypothetical protein
MSEFLSYLCGKINITNINIKCWYPSVLKVSSELSYHGKLVSDCCLMPNEPFFSYIMERVSYIRWDDDHVHLVLDA